jgi:hypothetical protein
MFVQDKELKNVKKREVEELKESFIKREREKQSDKSSSTYSRLPLFLGARFNHQQ